MLAKCSYQIYAMQMFSLSKYTDRCTYTHVYIHIRTHMHAHAHTYTQTHIRTNKHTVYSYTRELIWIQCHIRTDYMVHYHITGYFLGSIHN